MHTLFFPLVLIHPHCLSCLRPPRPPSSPPRFLYWVPVLDFGEDLQVLESFEFSLSQENDVSVSIGLRCEERSLDFQVLAPAVSFALLFLFVFHVILVSVKPNACSSVFVFLGGKSGLKMKQLPFMAVVSTVMLFVVYRTLKYQYYQEEIDKKWNTREEDKVRCDASRNLKGLPRGIIQHTSDFEFRPLWSPSSLRSKVNVYSNRNLLAMAVGVKQKHNVDAMVQKFLPDNFTIILFHYDANVDGWWDLNWSSKAIHITAQNQTKWWFAKRFLHPDIVSIYDYIFLWDEDLGVEHFSPSRYIEIVKEEGLEISQPALDPNSTEIHHRITVRARTKKVHRRVYELRGNTRCSEASKGPPCTGFVEGMAPVFSRSAWDCTWHLIQNDLVHGWGVDMKIGYCAQGDRTQNVGVVDTEYVVHKGIQTLGGSGHETDKVLHHETPTLRHHGAASDPRIEIRRQSTWELQVFKDRWNRAVAEDKSWVNPFKSNQRRMRHRKRNNLFS
ncbi:unnamed protein product [Sphenostylis stenocarpa]|uniref:Lysine ketoglutarate reductase trans-splicing-like protein n=1 Tax=Sphenostylis stenocarpa TaxID=92480 RepID=A0AA86VX36_9FABA|nr:unnamed protein product [Sphenostylis stenocarpa]